MKFKLNSFVLYSISLLVIGCKSDFEKVITNYPYGTEIQYYDSRGNLIKDETYSNDSVLVGLREYKDGIIKTRKLFDGVKLVSEYNIDMNRNASLKIFNENNTIIYGKGKVDEKGREIGWWDFYNHNKVLIEKQDCIVLDGEEIINQNIVYDSEGNIDSLRSHFVDFSIKQKSNTGVYNVSLIYNPKINKNSFVFICLGENVNEDYSNIDLIALDTIVPDQITKSFTVVFKEASKKLYRGIVVERYSKEPNTSNKPVKYSEVKTYFEKVFINDEI